ncbi:MAG: HAMP domain-containing protein [Acidobacteria bacterium]|nr:HAMP domain-containing protein [Acidobacteriota bacterium]
MFRRLAQRLILALTVIVIIIAAISGLITVRSQERQLLDSMILGADQLSRGIAAATWHAMLADNRNSAYSVMQTIAEKQGIDRIRIFNRDGIVMYSTAPGETGRTRVDKSSEACAVCHATTEPRMVLAAHSRARVFRSPMGHRSLAMVTPIYNEPSCSQADCHAHPKSIKVLGVLEVALSIQPVDHEVADMKWRASIVTGIEILLISVFIFFFTRRFVARPVQQLVEATKEISDMRLDTPIEVKGGSQEIDELASSFSAMRRRLKSAMNELNQFAETLEAKVTERTEQLQQAQKKLMQTDRLASLGQLSASVAHEINNPVSGVLNLAMLMQRILKDDGIPKERIPEFRKYLTQVIHETTRVGRIVSDLLSFSRRSKPQRSLAGLNRITRSTVSLVAHKAKLAGVELETKLDETLPDIPCDSSQIQQVVLNLVMNAIEATQGKAGRVEVLTKLGPNRDAVVLTVADNGEGIPPENLSKIFDPFFTTKPEGKGVGLGLAVLYGIVEAHGGEVDVKSEVGSGTIFTVRLPLTAPDPSPGVVQLPMTAPVGTASANRMD